MYTLKLSSRQMNDLFCLREELKRQGKKATIIGLVREAVDKLLIEKTHKIKGGDKNGKL